MKGHGQRFSEFVARIRRTQILSRIRLKHYARSLFAAVVAATILLGVSAFVGFFVGVLIGGPLGVSIIDGASRLIEICMSLAVVALFFGIGYIYVSGKHSLSLEDTRVVDSHAVHKGERRVDDTTESTKG